MTGMRALVARGFTHALTMDGDGQHSPREIPTMLTAAREEPAAIVIGVRRRGDQEVAGINLFGNRFANLCVRSAAGVPLPTRSPVSACIRSRPCCVCHSKANISSTNRRRSSSRRAPACRSVRSVDVYYPPVAERRSHYRKVVDTLRIIRVVRLCWCVAEGSDCYFCGGSGARLPAIRRLLGRAPWHSSCSLPGPEGMNTWIDSHPSFVISGAVSGSRKKSSRTHSASPSAP